MKELENLRKERLEAALEEKKERRRLYLERERVMLSGGAQSYGIGSRNLTRFNTDLAQVRAAIDKLSQEIAEIENELESTQVRKRVGLVFRDRW